MVARRAFTLVELLCVIGIIAILIAIILPAVAGAKRCAVRLACASQMRQVGVAFRMYAEDHKGWWPMSADTYPPQPEDWIYWQRGRDINRSALAKYLGGNFKVLRCPADTAAHQSEVDAIGGSSHEIYDFSYTVNESVTGLMDMTRKLWPVPPCNLTKVRRPCEKILLVDQTMAYCGRWKMAEASTFVPDTVSARHWRGSDMLDERIETQILKGYGNIIFVDGHYEFLERWRTTDQVLWDPLFEGVSCPTRRPPGWKRPGTP